MLRTLDVFATNGQVTLNIVDSFLDILRAILTTTDYDDYDIILLYFAQKNAMSTFCGTFLIFSTFHK